MDMEAVVRTQHHAVYRHIDGGKRIDQAQTPCPNEFDISKSWIETAWTDT